MTGTKSVLPFMASLILLFTGARPAQAQRFASQRFGVGVYAGVSIPRGNFNSTSGVGPLVGALLETNLTSAVDVRLEGQWTRFGDRELSDAGDSGGQVARFSAEAFVGMLTAELNLGTDSAAYPGDNSVSPWLIAGPGIYRFDFETECVVGGCANLDLTSSAETHWGVSIGAGATVPLVGLRPFVEARYHLVFPIADQAGNLTMYQVYAGLKFR